MSKKEKSTFSHFFREDAQAVLNISNGESGQRAATQIGLAGKEEFPRIKTPVEVSEDAFKTQWQRLRSFFRNADNQQGLASDLWPVIMSPFFTKNMVGTNFPVWLADEDFDGEGAFCLSLKEILAQALNETGEGENNATILKKNIERILHIANKQLADKKPQLFQPAIYKILDELEEQLSISGNESQAFRNDLENLKKALPKSGVLLPYSINASFQILEAAMVAKHHPARKKLKHDIAELKSKLKDLLRVEREKGPERKKPDQLQDSLAFVDSMVKFDELSAIMPDAGSESMGPERVQRIKEVIKDLEEAGAMLDQHGFLFIDELLYNNKNIDWENLFGSAEIKVYKKGKGCDAIGSAFEKNMAICTRFFIAKRIGELELENKYQPDIHDGYFKHFNWQGFSTDELNNCPHFILIADDGQLFDTEFSKLSAMLSDNIPVKIVAVKREEFIDYNQNGSKKEMSGLHTQAELGALMLSHKNIYVAQSTSITPIYLFNGFKEGLSAFAPAFFYVLNTDEKIHKNPYVWTSATVEGRDFPGFTFKGLLGTPWGSRFAVENNPQPTLPWPVHEFTIIDENGDKIEKEFPFTFADQAVLNPAYHHYYLPVNSSFWNDDFIPMTEYMKNSGEENIGKVPFIWMMDAANELHKVAVSWPIVLATQERLDFWRFLQENSGINNYHVARAVEQAKAEMKAVHDFEIEQLKKEQEAEIQNIKKEEAGKVMENLTSVLLNLDTTNVVAAGLPVSSPPPPIPVAAGPGGVAAEAATEDIEEEEDVLSNEPYIDTALCTSCNECTDMNGAMFNYNADKMAFIADANAGTFRELVEAAEICPVGIIHPGSPLNPDEPDLDSLIERAAKFN